MIYPSTTSHASTPATTALTQPARPPVRPSRPGRAGRRGVVQWGTERPVMIGPGQQLDQLQGRPNPWVETLSRAEFAATSKIRDGERPVLTSSGDEREWLSLESGTPEVRTAMNRRISDLLGGGVRLRKGRGVGSQRLFDFANFMLPWEQITQMSMATLLMIFRGWSPMNTPMLRRIWPEMNVEVVTPHRVLPAQNWQFDWTDGVDPWLIYKTPINLGLRTGFARHSAYNMRALANQMYWFTPSNDLTVPYGIPLHFFGAFYVWAERQLRDVAQAQAPISQGMTRIQSSIDPTLNDDELSRFQTLTSIVQEQLANLSATGAVVLPAGIEVSFDSITSAMLAWTAHGQNAGAVITSLYAGSNLAISSVGESQGSRAASITHAEGLSDLARVDAQIACGQWGSKFLRPYLTWNLPQIVPELPRLGPWEQWIPAQAMPQLVFNSASRPSVETLDVLERVKRLGVEGAEDIRIDAEDILAGRGLRLLDEDDVGAAIDLSRREPTIPVPPGVDRPLEEDEDGNLRNTDEDGRGPSPRRDGR